MEAIITPDYVIDRVASLRPEDCERYGIRAIGFDVDGTLTEYLESMAETEQSTLTALGRAGLDLFVISNAFGKRAAKLPKIFGDYMPTDHIITPADCVDPDDPHVTPDIHSKPMPDMILHAFTMMPEGFRPDQFLMIGDQLFKDPVAGHLAGAQTALVAQLGIHDHPSVQLQRAAERSALQQLGMPYTQDMYPTHLARLERRWQKY